MMPLSLPLVSDLGPTRTSSGLTEMVQGALHTAWHVGALSKLQGPREGLPPALENLPHRGWIRVCVSLCLPWQGGVGTQEHHTWAWDAVAWTRAEVSVLSFLRMPMP